MSWPELSVRHHKRQTDRAIHQAYAQLAAHPSVCKSFDSIICRVRLCAPQALCAPMQNGRHPGVDTLIHLAHFHHAHIRNPLTWRGHNGSWQAALASLVDHMVCQYRVPPFLASCWRDPSPAADEHRQWHIAHASGSAFRSLRLPLRMSRSMERLFLNSPDHCTLGYAMRYAELAALRVPTAIMQAVMKTRIATDFTNSDFWRTVWHFFITNQDDLEPDHVGPLIDYIQAIRHDHIHVDTPIGHSIIDPPLPDFSIKGRTAQSMRKRMKAWHGSLREVSARSYSWANSPFKPFAVLEKTTGESDGVRRWQLVELTTWSQLQAEGAALHHCVASYAPLCHQGRASIWSLRMHQGESVRSVMTVEIDPLKRVIVQARGKQNRTPSPKSMQLLQQWADRERLRIAL